MSCVCGCAATSRVRAATRSWSTQRSRILSICSAAWFVILSASSRRVECSRGFRAGWQGLGQTAVLGSLQDLWQFDLETLNWCDWRIVLAGLLRSPMCFLFLSAGFGSRAPPARPNTACTFCIVTHTVAIPSWRCRYPASYSESNGISPGGRYDHATTCDSSGNVWVFGGNGCYGASTSGACNDLWK